MRGGIAVLITFSTAAWAQPAYLLADLNPGDRPISATYDCTAGSAFYGGSFYFSAGTAATGNELWRSDGTPAGTVLVADIGPGEDPGHVASITASTTHLYFLAGAAAELWRTDGTPGGTTRLTRSDTLAAAFPLTASGGQVFFGCRGLGQTAWSLCAALPDGGVTAGAPTAAVFDSAAGFQLPMFAAPGDRLWFADATDAGAQVFLTDGTAAGTTLLGRSPSFPMTAYPNVWPIGTSGSTWLTWSNGEVFAVDTTPGSMRSLATGAATFQVAPGVPLGGDVWFVANVSGTRLWRANASGASTVATFAASTYSRMQLVGGQLLAEGSFEAALPTDGGTTPLLLGPLPPRSSASLGARLLYFGGNSTPTQLVSTDGTVAGTSNLHAFLSETGLRCIYPGPGRGCFIADDGVAGGKDLWCSDGASLSLVELAPGREGVGSAPVGFESVGGSAFVGTIRGVFEVRDGGATYIHDGGMTDRLEHVAGRLLVPDFFEGMHSYDPATGTDALLTPDGGGSCRGKVAHVGNTAWFTRQAGQSYNKRQFFITDGTAPGTRMILERSTGIEVNESGDLFPVGGKVLGFNNGELLTIDSDGGTSVLGSPFDADGDGTRLVALGRLFFTSLPGGITELWVSDGTAPGTLPLRAFSGIALGGGAVRSMVASDSLVFFIGAQSNTGDELWVTDGTTSGTHVVLRLATGRQDGVPSPRPGDSALAATSRWAIFVGLPGGGTQPAIFASDGTAAGTRQLLTLPVGVSALWSLVSAGGVVFFDGFDPAHGHELWQTDGTLEGTVLVQDINPGPMGSFPTALKAIGSTLYFSATTSDAGAEPWAMPIDRTAPIITPVITGTLGKAGWYVGNLVAGFSVSDPDSAVLRTVGCDAGAVTQDTPGLSRTCTAASLGGYSEVSLTVKLDGTPPHFLDCPSAAQTVEASSPDGGRFPPPVLTADEADAGIHLQWDPAAPLPVGRQIVTATVEDEAGNSTPCEMMVDVADTTPPVLVCRTGEVFVTGGGVFAVNADDVTVTDKVDTSPRLDFSPPLGTTLMPGATDVEVRASDRFDNVSSPCTLHVRVADDRTPPVEHSHFAFGCGAAAGGPWVLIAAMLVMRRRRPGTLQGIEVNFSSRR